MKCVVYAHPWKLYVHVQTLQNIKISHNSIWISFLIGSTSYIHMRQVRLEFVSEEVRKMKVSWTAVAGNGSVMMSTGIKCMEQYAVQLFSFYNSFLYNYWMNSSRICRYMQQYNTGIIWILIYSICKKWLDLRSKKMPLFKKKKISEIKIRRFSSVV